MSKHSVEEIKRQSRGLRGRLVESLTDPVTGALADDDQVVIKYHGSYQQDDRDRREERRRAKLEPAYGFMIRVRMPGGVLSPPQWLELDAIARRHAERGLRLTTRQAVQFHGVAKGELKSTLQAIRAALLDTLAACGDVNRNVIVGINPRQSALHAEVYATAAALSEHLLPKTRAYYEIWFDEQRIDGGDPAEEPLYGATYLPRKFKIAFAVPPRNDVDVYAQDLSYVALIERDRILGYSVLVGGGMGCSHGDASTYPRLAEPFAFIAPEQVIPLAVAVIGAQRDLGERGQRKHGKMKYTIDRLGLETFRREVERRFGAPLAAPRPFVFTERGDRFGWLGGDDGRWHLGLRIPAGRVQDGAEGAWQSGLRRIAEHLVGAGQGQFRLTPNQNLVIADLDPALQPDIDALVGEYGLDRCGRRRPLATHALACVALPTCGLAMAEAERYLPRLLECIQALLTQHGLTQEPIHLRISGCPNGCSRPYLAEIALVGKAPGRYNLLLGGDALGTRLNALALENADEGTILAHLDRCFADFVRERKAGEGFGDYLHRSGRATHAAVAVQRGTGAT